MERSMERKSRFSVMEIFIVLAIVLLVAPVVRPKVLSATFAPLRAAFTHTSR